MNDHDWQTFFDQQALQYMDEGFVKATLSEVEFLIEHLQLVPGMRVLDVGCGTGRHVVELAKRGLLVTGVDISAGMLAEARQAAAAAQVSVAWVQSPAQDYQADQPFDAVYSVCEGALSLLGQHDPFDRDQTVLAMMFAALKPGGRGLITVSNGMRFLRLYSAADVEAGRFDPLTLVESGSMEIDTEAGKRALPVRERGYVPSELRLMLQHAGFVVEGIGGGTAGAWRLSPPDLDGMEILALLSRRPAEKG